MNWHWTTLRRVLSLSSASIPIREDQFYKQVIVQPYPRGIALKTVKSGLDFPKKQQRLIRSGQFILSKLRMRRSIWGIVPPELDGAVVPHHYITFDLAPGFHPDYFAAYLATLEFKQAVLSACTREGRLLIRRFERIPIPLPAWEQQLQVAELWRAANAVQQQTADMLESIAQLKSGVAEQLLLEANRSWEKKKLGECAVVGHNLVGDYVLSVLPPDHIAVGAAASHPGQIGILPNPELDSQFLYYYLESRKPALQTALSGITNINEALQTFPLMLPTLYEQRKIAMALQQHDEVLLRLRAEQAALSKAVIGLMQLIFSNKLLNLKEIIPILHNFSSPLRD